MSNTDPFVQFKEAQRQGWATFAPIETFTTPPAANLVEFADIKAGQKVLDCGCGTGVVAVTAARQGAQVKGLDLAPALIERAKMHAGIANLEIDFLEGDVEALPFKDGQFDVVLSQFGHMFAPRPEVAIKEMLRVLKPGGRIAFSTWPPDHFVGRLFGLVGKYVPPPPGAAPAPAWGDPNIVRERLGNEVKDLTFDRGEMLVSGLSPQHVREMFERSTAPLIKFLNEYKNNPQKISEARAEIEALINIYFKKNQVRQHYLMTRATKI